MSDNAEEKPRKLKLSRDVNPPRDSAESPPEADAAPASSDESKPTLKLDRSKVKSSAKAGGLDFDPDDPFGDILPKKDKPASKSQSDSPPKKPNLQIDRSKLETAKQTNPPPELRSKPAPRVDDGSGRKLMETLETLPKDSPAKHGPPITSILMILAMILLIGAAGAGIWWVLKDDETSTQEAQTAPPPVETPPAPSTTPPAPPSGPIGKAKEAIARKEAADAENLADSGLLENSAETPPSDPEPAPPEESFEPAPAEPAPAEPETEREADAPAPPAPAEPAPTAPSDELQAEVSEFLSAAEIGAVRAGRQARVMLNGISYSSGEEVHAATGLIFVGTKDDRLVFRDDNGIYYVKSF